VEIIEYCAMEQALVVAEIIFLEVHPALAGTVE
jgi:hypothetical protein